MKILEQVLQIIVVSLSGLLLVAMGLQPLYTSPDVSMYLEIGRRLLEGQLPYVDYYEINFPVIHYLNIIPAQIALWTDINVITVLLLCVWLLTIWSIWISIHFSKPLFTGNMRPVVYLFPVCLLVYSHWWFVVSMYGQREHLFILLFMPAFFLRLIHWQSATPSKATYGDFIVGFIAGIAVSIKPHFVLIPIITELYGFIFVHRSLRRFLHLEVLGLITFGILHVLYFLLLPQVFLGLLDIIALVRVGYSGYGGEHTWLELVQLYSIPRTILVFMLMLFIHRKMRTPVAILVKALSVLGLTAVTIFVIQGRGFGYHEQILKLMETIVFSIFIVEIVVSIRKSGEAPFPRLHRLPVRIRRTIQLFLILIIPIFTILVSIPTVFSWYLFTTMPNWYMSKNEITDIIETYTEVDEGIIVVDYQVDGAFPLTQRINRRQVARHLVTYPYLMAPAGNLPDAMAEWTAILATDIEEEQPTIILVWSEINDYLLNSGFIETYIHPGYVRYYEGFETVVYVKQDAVNESLERE